MTGTPVTNKEDLSRTSSSLLRSAKQGQETAWERLVNHYSPRVERWSRAAGLQAADTADVLQEVFLAVAKNISRFRRDRPRDSFRVWLHSITINKIRDHWRSARKLGRSAMPLTTRNEPAASEESTESTTIWLSTRNAWIHDCMEAVRQVQNDIPQRDWGIFELSVIESKPADEVAECFDVTRNVVYLIKSRILKRLKEALSNKDADRND